jgi:hypothetical protein
MRCRQDWESTDTDPVAVPESSEGVLYTLSAPEFRPRKVPPLEVVALGSGAGVAENLRAYRPLLMCTAPTKAAQVFVDALAGFFSENQESSVGGMMIVAQAIDGQVYSLAPAMGPTGSVRVECEGHRFVVVNEATGRRIPLRYPSELIQNAPRGPLLFNDFRDLLQAEREGLRQRREHLAERLRRRENEPPGA